LLQDLPDIVQDVVKKAVNYYPAGWQGGVCAYQMFDKKTGASRGGRTSRGECHASLTNAAKQCIVVNAHKTTWAKSNPEFLLWVTQQSPFSQGVLNRDDKDELFNHASVMDTDVIGNGGALWLCKALRHFTEDTHKPDMWDKLRKKGLDGLQAFIGSDILLSGGGPSFSNTHVSLFAYSNPDILRKHYDEFRTIKRIDGYKANRGGYGLFGYGEVPKKVINWGSLAGKTVKKSDGWGGYVEVQQPCDAKEYAEKLREIFTGDPSNVK
jgi:hypothetical protein